MCEILSISNHNYVLIVKHLKMQEDLEMTVIEFAVLTCCKFVVFTLMYMCIWYVHFKG